MQFQQASGSDDGLTFWMHIYGIHFVQACNIQISFQMEINYPNVTNIFFSMCNIPFDDTLSYHILRRNSTDYDSVVLLGKRIVLSQQMSFDNTTKPIIISIRKVKNVNGWLIANAKRSNQTLNRSDTFLMVFRLYLISVFTQNFMREIQDNNQRDEE